jgi:CotH protein/chitobiase/beta-hexosaminidase-like protein/lamin tail-like protein
LEAAVHYQQQVKVASPAPRWESIETRLLLSAEPIITEFMALNDSVLVDEDSDYSDWLEIHNPSTSALDLEGWYLTDDASDLTKWRFDATSLDAGEYLLVFASDKDRTGPTGELHTNFKLSGGGEYLALVSDDGSTVTSEYDFPEQQADVSYGLLGDEERYFASPTPGEPNNQAISESVWFSRPGGTFTDPFGVELAVNASDAVIYYTLDGTPPDETSMVYTGTIAIDESTQLRAQAYEPGLEPGPIVGESYIALDPTVQDFTSDLPIVVVDTFRRAIYESNYSPAYSIFIEGSQTDRASLTDLPQYAGRSGYRVRGTSSSNFPKKQYKFETWDESNQDKNVSLLGLPAESDWILQGPYSDKSLMRNHLTYQWAREMGDYATRTRFVEVFLNTGGGAVTESDYVGVYMVMESITRDAERVDIAELDPSDSSEPEITGGYILEKTADNRRPVDPNQYFQSDYNYYFTYQDPKYDELTSVQKAYIEDYVEDFEAALNGANFADPETGYAAYIDVDSFIDYELLSQLTRNNDAWFDSIYLHKDREGKLALGPVWDFNIALGNINYNDNWYTNGWLSMRTWGWFGRLFDDPAFAQRWMDRWGELREGILSTSKIHQDIDDTASILAESADRNFDRWNILGSYVWPNADGYTSRTTYQSEVDYLKDWVEDRAAWIDSQFLPSVGLSQDGGDVTSGYALQMTTPYGTIHYTLDGSDPIDGGTTIASGQSIVLNGTQEITLRARVKSVDQWGPLKAERFNVGGSGDLASRLSVSEIMYHPAGGGQELEYLELLNLGADPLFLGGLSIDRGIELTFPEDALLPAGGRALLVSFDPDTQPIELQAFLDHYSLAPGQATLFGPFVGALGNGGERIRAVDRDGQTVLDFTYPDLRPADGDGASLVASNPAGDLDDPDNWRGSTEYLGSPGSPEDGPFQNVVINEVLTHTDLPLLDSIELYNTADYEVDIGGWWVSDSSADFLKYRIPDGTLLDAGEYLVIDETDFNASGGVDPADFGLDGAHGDQVWLMVSNELGQAVSFADFVEFGATAGGESLGRLPNGLGELYPMLERTLGSTNAGPRVGPLVISEFFYNPGSVANEENLEFIEVYNPTGETVDLTGWRIRGGVDYDFSTGAMLPAGMAALVVAVDTSTPIGAAKAHVFQNVHGISSGIPLYGPFQGRLGDGGDSIRLERPDQPPLEEPEFTPHLLEDRVTYDDQAPWATSADGEGDSLHRLAAEAWGPLAGSWEAATPTPGLVGEPPQGDLTSDGTVDYFDIDTLRARFGDSSADLDGDADADEDDVAYLVQEILGTQYGDANLDGVVGDADYTIWADNYMANMASWSMADFNGSGIVTEADYTFWADNYGSGTSAAAMTIQNQTPDESPPPEESVFSFEDCFDLLAITRALQVPEVLA